MLAPDKIEKLNYNFDERCKNLYIDTKSKFKNFIRFDTQKDILKKDNLNRRISRLISDLKMAQISINGYIELYNGIQESFSGITNLINQRESETGTLENKLKDLSNILEGKHKLFLKIKEYVSNIPDTVDKLLDKTKSVRNNTSTDASNSSEDVKEILNIVNEYNICERDYNAKISRLRQEKLMYEQQNNISKVTELDNKIKYYPKSKKYIMAEIELQKVNSKKISDLNSNNFKKNFRDILEFRNSNKLKKLENKWKDLKSIRANLKSEAISKYAVTTSKHFNNMKKPLLNSINEIKKIINEIVKQKNYGDGLFKGFFTFFSTKEKQIFKFESQIQNINKNIEITNTNYETVSSSMSMLANYLIQNGYKREQIAYYMAFYQGWTPVPVNVTKYDMKNWFDRYASTLNSQILDINTDMLRYILASKKLKNHIKEANCKCYYIRGEGKNSVGVKLGGVLDWPPQWDHIKAVDQFVIV